VRAIPTDEIGNVVQGRDRTDFCNAVPEKYTPPDFIAKALQQSSVKCTWEDGDIDRDKMLTSWGLEGETWKAMTEGDDMKAYLANSSDSDDSDSDDSENDDSNADDKKKKMRKLLLGGDASSSDSDNDEVADGDNEDDFFNESNLDYDSDDVDKEMTITFGGSTRDLEDKLRKSKEDKKGGSEEPSPWEKYQQKRKEKRKERKKNTKDKKQDDEGDYEDGDTAFGESAVGNLSSEDEDDDKAATKEELSALIGDENNFDEKHNFDMRGIVRASKNSNKNLKGQRKKKEDRKAKVVVGLNNEFAIDTADNRFAALMDGDSRYGIDKTDVNFKETPAMEEIMKEQTKRRKKKRKKEDVVVSDVSAKDKTGGGASAMALAGLVSSIKKKVKQ